MSKCKDCDKYASYGYTSKVACKAHKELDMTDLAHKRCIIQGCEKRAYWGFNKTKDHCGDHKEAGMIREVRLCEHPGCKTEANFNYIGKKGGDYCSKHKLDGMIALKKTSCIHEGCEIRPSYGYDRVLYCSQHAPEDSNDLVTRICLEDGCKKRASYGFIGREYCAKHKKSEMMSMQARCKHCNKKPSFGYTKPEYCADHKTDDMRNLTANRCNVCDTFANYGYTRAEYCAEHKEPDMQDVNNKHTNCESCGLRYRIYKNNKLCSYCDPNSGQKIKESEVKQMLKRFNYNFASYDCRVPNDCNLKYRPDFVFDCDTHFIVIEVDENAHKYYNKECELVRMNNITHSLGLPTRFIRYNPDHPKYNLRQKQAKLREILDANLAIDSLDSIEPVYLFYA